MPIMAPIDDPVTCMKFVRPGFEASTTWIISDTKA